jgi:hypothetical protein
MYRVILSVGLRQGLSAQFHSQEFGALAGALDLVRDIERDQPKLRVSFMLEQNGEIMQAHEWRPLL